MALVRRRRLLRVIPRVNVTITAGLAPAAGQTGFQVTGAQFGTATGNVRYNGLTVTITAWSASAITVTWPDLAFLATGSQTGLDTSYTLAVTTADGAQGTRSVTTSKKAGDIYRQITALTGIFANDPDVVIGDYYNWRTVAGTIVDVSADGYISGATLGASGQYAVWDGVWSNTATVTLA